MIRRTYFLLSFLRYVLVIIICMVYGIKLTSAVNNVSTSMVYWQYATRMHSFSFVLEVRGPTKNPEYMT